MSQLSKTRMCHVHNSTTSLCLQKYNISRVQQSTCLIRTQTASLIFMKRVGLQTILAITWLSCHSCSSYGTEVTLIFRDASYGVLGNTGCLPRWLKSSNLNLTLRWVLWKSKPNKQKTQIPTNSKVEDSSGSYSGKSVFLGLKRRDTDEKS